MKGSAFLRSLTALSMLISVSGQAADNLYFSEYVEGSSNNKALEIANNTGVPVDLSEYQVDMYFNGNTSASTSITLSGILQAGNVFVLADDGAAQAILDVADQTPGNSFFNGDDAIALSHNGVIVDVIGQIGVDPGSQWGSGDTGMQNNTLRRLASVDGGDTNPDDAFDPAVEWLGVGQDVFSDLGSYDLSPPVANLMINELDADTAGSDVLEFIELFDGGLGGTSLDGYILVLFNGSSDTSYRTVDLSGMSTDDEGYFVVGNAAVNSVDLVIPGNGIQNGADAAALYQADASAFPNGTAITQEGLIDAIVYGTNDGDDAGLLPLLETGQPQVNEASNSSPADSNQRCENGTGGLRNTDSYIQAAPTPGAENSCDVELVLECGAPATLISAVQGSGAESPLAGTGIIEVEAVVVADFQAPGGLNGFFLQEEDADQDADSATSEGVFVYTGGGEPLTVGDTVRVAGRVVEFNGLTEITSLTGLELCASGADVSAASVSLPLASADDLEALEGMSVVVTSDLTVTDNNSLGRYGQLTLSSGGRLMTPTQVALPGDAANAVAASNALNQLILDDGSTASNPDFVPFPTAEGLSALNTVRVGDTVSSLAGVMTYAFGAYRVHATQQPVFVPDNSRTAAPSLTGQGSLTVASFNVLNYFNGRDGFPTARGADSLEEFERQRTKIIAALVAMDADIVGLIEIENNGYGADSAIQDLVNGLSAEGLDYAFVHPGVDQIGTDAIAVGFIYKPETVSLVGEASILDASVDPDFVDTRNRPALAQTFTEIASGGTLTIAVNHLKSKGSACGDADPDLNDGQGNCNLTRLLAANALVNWLGSSPTGSTDDDVLIIGDLNAYAMEDPIRAIEAAGYSNLAGLFEGAAAYSYVFFGQSGSLDHALANESLTEQVVAATEWHINADEPRALDYNMEFKSAGQLLSYYESDAYRASDHDPLVIELSLTVPVPGDFNGDKVLDFIDKQMLIDNFSKTVDDSNSQYDLNGDGRITGRDLADWNRLWFDFRKKR